MLVIGEMSSGILVACVPTLGPVLFPDRFGPRKGVRYQYKLSHRPLHGEGPAGNTSVSVDSISQTPCITLDEDGTEVPPSIEVIDKSTGNQRHVEEPWNTT